MKRYDPSYLNPSDAKASHSRRKKAAERSELPAASTQDHEEHVSADQTNVTDSSSLAFARLELWDDRTLPNQLESYYTRVSLAYRDAGMIHEANVFADAVSTFAKINQAYQEVSSAYEAALLARKAQRERAAGLLQRLRASEENTSAPEMSGLDDSTLDDSYVEAVQPYAGISVKEADDPGDLATLETVVFDDEEKFVRFIEYVYEHFRGAGLALTDAPIATSVRVTRGLLRRLPAEVVDAMRPVGAQDLKKALARRGKAELSDIEELEQFHFVALPPAQPSDQPSEDDPSLKSQSQ